MCRKFQLGPPVALKLAVLGELTSAACLALALGGDAWTLNAMTVLGTGLDTQVASAASSLATIP